MMFVYINISNYAVTYLLSGIFVLMIFFLVAEFILFSSGVPE